MSSSFQPFKTPTAPPPPMRSLEDITNGSDASHPTGSLKCQKQQKLQQSPLEMLGSADLMQLARLGKGQLDGVNMREKLDLFDLLKDHSMEQLPGYGQWPGLLVGITNSLIPLPRQVMQKYHSHNQYCYCGLLPEIKRAWAAMDSTLFLWRYDRPNDVATEYKSDKQPITAVGIVRPRDGVFFVATKYVLIVCTVTEIYLLSVSFSSGINSDEYDGLVLQQLSYHSTQTDNVPMSKVKGTANGRIFVGGSNGHLYEIMYRTNDTWMTSRCYKICCTKNLISSLVPSIWKTASAIDQIVIDEERFLIYTLNQLSHIQAFYMGQDGQDSLQRIAHISDFIAAATTAIRGKEVFRSIDKKNFQVVGLYCIPSSESSKLHMMAVTNSSVRVYFTTARMRKLTEFTSLQRSEALQAVYVLPELPQLSSNNMFAQAYQKTAQGQRYVNNALYHEFGLVLSSAYDGADSPTEVLAVARNLTLPPEAIGSSFGMREVVSVKDLRIPGQAQVLVPEPSSALEWSEVHCYMKDELYCQIFCSAPRIVVMTGHGVLTLLRRRPLEVLLAVLEERSQEKLKQFFENYGKEEAAAMCFHVVCSDPQNIPNYVFIEARQALESPQLVGIPQLSATHMIFSNQGGSGSIPNQVVVEFSGAYQGLVTYVARLTNWAQKKQVLLQTNQEQGSTVCCGFSPEELQWLERRLRALSTFLAQYCDGAGQRLRRSASFLPVVGDGAEDVGNLSKRRRVTQDAHLREEDSIRSIWGFVQRCAEAVALVRILADNHIGRLVSLLDPQMQEQFREKTFGQLVVESEEEQNQSLAKQLVLVLLQEHLTSSGVVHEDLAQKLQRNCPSYFQNQDKVYYQAVGYLQSAEKTEDFQSRQEAIHQALDLMLQVPLTINLPATVLQLQDLECYDGIIQLCQVVAQAHDPYDQACGLDAEGETARQKRNICYQQVVRVLRDIIFSEQGTHTWTSEGQREDARQSIMRGVKNSSDKLLHFTVFKAMIESQLIDELLEESNFKFLEEFLLKKSGLTCYAAEQIVESLDADQIYLARLLAKFYTRNQKFRLAAMVYRKLAEMVSSSGGKDVLQQRLIDLEDATQQAKCAGDNVLATELQERTNLAKIQNTIFSEVDIQQHLDMEEIGVRLQNLSMRLLDASELYNEYAQQLQLWASCLRIIHFCQYQDQDRVQRLWDLYLRQGYNEKESEGLEEQLLECCARVKTLGADLFPDPNTFPTEHVTLKLEQISLTMWPQGVQKFVVDIDEQIVIQAIYKACKEDDEAVLNIYDVLVFGEVEDGRVRGHLRLREKLVNSLSYHCRNMGDRLFTEQPRTLAYRFGGQYIPNTGQASRLAMTCRDKYAPEARRLGLDTAEDRFREVVELFRLNL
eukprot:TRINITY_DN6033_c0_g3_i1.p1 TRINITY_DN6033_c0_g3~~TRINITY_DN6033_c0_g3_i1.p1  ORF type:complete len:1374 (-),score=127.37 TRINITY_DN6033_c0_g3_i1:632-4753(-)